MALERERMHDVEQRIRRTPDVATGTFACPSCDAPVAPAPGGMALTDRVACPFCGSGGVVRDFLTLGDPTRPARVVVRVSGARRLALRPVAGHGQRP
jgi:hypothetical protein